MNLMPRGPTSLRSPCFDFWCCLQTWHARAASKDLYARSVPQAALNALLPSLNQLVLLDIFKVSKHLSCKNTKRNCLESGSLNFPTSFCGGDPAVVKPSVVSWLHFHFSYAKSAGLAAVVRILVKPLMTVTPFGGNFFLNPQHLHKQ